MNELQIFNFKGNEVRTLTIDGEPYFVGKEVAEILGYSNTRDALLNHVDNDDKRIIQRSQNTTLEIPNRGLTVINESGVYSLVFGSKLEKAKEFKHWVTAEVLPAIRKHGAYLTDKKAYEITHNPNSLADLLIQAGEQLRKKDLVIQEMQPKALFADAVATSKTSILIGDLAKILKQNGVNIGQKRLFEWLRDHGYLVKRNGSDYNMPTQRAMELGLFEIKETVITHADGHTTISKTPKVTGKGQQYFINKFLANEARE
ncbi:phage antirepressor KilAC domain-containing protein [Allobaculum stercoricanis]|uniref:phage antirepressor n=1 Tax=Allobaculum stercoricanis TaxID=174709 RepID=UPI0029433C9B|nr:phage antirepressor KilAC domain-containing protein [Allobaculum stercoricanis]